MERGGYGALLRFLAVKDFPPDGPARARVQGHAVSGIEADPLQQAGQQLAVAGIVVDRDGKLTAKFIGPLPSDAGSLAPDVTQAIEAVLAKAE